MFRFLLLSLLFWIIGTAKPVLPEDQPLIDGASDDLDFSQDQFVAQINPVYTQDECTPNSNLDGVDEEIIQKRNKVQNPTTCPTASQQSSGGLSNNIPSMLDEQALTEKLRIDAATEKRRCPDRIHKFLRTCGGPEVGIYPGNKVLNCISGEIGSLTSFTLYHHHHSRLNRRIF